MTPQATEKGIDAKLPKFLLPRSTGNLTRVGRHGDGGYLVLKSDVILSEVLISCGISNDWSFEKEFFQLNPKVVIRAFDGSINRVSVIRSAVQNIWRPWRVRRFVRALFDCVDFFMFFRGERKFIPKYVGLHADERFSNHVALDTIFNEELSDSIFIKLDIEGSEYRCLDQIVANQHRLRGLVIEFHDCDIHLSKVKKFVHEMSLTVVHVHANNYAPVRECDKLPLVLEVTFSRELEHEGDSDVGHAYHTAALPHALDVPNNQSEPEICLKF